nr:CsbD family protein [Wenzhouxiangella marina]
MISNSFKSKWDHFSARLKQEWGDLTDDEIKKAEGNIDELIAKISDKSGESRQAIAKKFNELKEKLDS